MVRRWIAALVLTGTLATTLLAGSLATGVGPAAPPAQAATSPSGVDVASWQHPGNAPIDWAAVRASGQSFAFIKADEGPFGSRAGYYTNPYFHSDWAAAGAHGLYRGTYQYARPRYPLSTAVEDARHFVATAGPLRGAGDLPHVLDLEEHGGLPAPDLIAWTAAWLQEVERLSGRAPMIYTGRYFWQTHMADTHAFSGYRLWVASWYYGPAPQLEPPPGTRPTLFGGWSTWTFWQYTDRANVPGITSLADMNIYCCGAANLAALADGRAGTASAGNPLGVLDGLERLSSGHHRLTGWALDPDTTAPIAVHVWAGDVFLGEHLADASRPDIAQLFPGWGPAHGFDVTVVPPPGATSICAYAINAGTGTTHPPLGCKPVSHQPFGAFDGATGGPATVTVGGWAIDPDTAEPVTVDVAVDGRPAGSWVADASRPDVGGAYPGFGDHHGFAVTINGVAAGARQVCVTIPNVGAGSAATSLGCRSVVVEPGPIGYWDVPPGHPFAGDISWLATMDVTQGYPDGSFQPQAPVTRQAMAAFLRRYDAAMGGDPVAGSISFTDVPAGHPFAADISWLAAAGITEGYGDGTFRPDEPVSRQAMAAFLARLYSRLGGTPTGAVLFTDVPAGHRFAAPIGWLAVAGISTGYEDGSFHPTEDVSRQAMAAFLHRLHLIVG